jgi:hypothetical protein
MWPYLLDKHGESQGQRRIDRANLDGSNATNIVPSGATWTPKQLQLDAKNRKLYWSDREGMRVMHSNFDAAFVPARTKLFDASLL